MTLWRVLLLFASFSAGLGLALGFSGCIQIGPSDDDGGADAAPTVQDQCSEMMAAFCSRANDCFGEDPNACYQPAVDACCGDACAKPATSDEQAIKACVLDIGKESCDDVVVSKLPPRCQMAITHE